MEESPLRSLADYSRFVGEMLNRLTIEHSTVAVWSVSSYTGIAEGEIIFAGRFRLRLREELDFDAALITSYGYEVYRGEERLYWYDDFPHLHEAALASIFPHHKHVPPDLKRNRIPAPALSFTTPNLPILIQEIEALLQQEDS